MTAKQDYLLPLQQIQVTPKLPPGLGRTAGEFVSVHYGDTHFPFADPAALRVLYAVLKDLKPQLVVHHGDLLDCYGISRYDKDPKHRVSLDKEIQQAAEHLATVARIAPKARRILIKGNHEDRLRRLLWNEASGPLREVLSLAKVEERLSWPSLLDLAGSGWEWQDTKEILFGKMILKHGSVVRQGSAMSARAEQGRYSKSGISGHTHRMGSYNQSDWNGVHGWFELGCMCGLNPTYVEDPNWQQGFAVVTWSKRRDYFSVEPVHISKGRALFRGTLYH
jgi:predicted phosphodiesterase